MFLYDRIICEQSYVEIIVSAIAVSVGVLIEFHGILIDELTRRVLFAK